MDCIIESGKCTTIGSPVNRITSISLHSLAGPAVLRTNDSTALSLSKPLLQPPVPEEQDTKG